MNFFVHPLTVKTWRQRFIFVNWTHFISKLKSVLIYVMKSKKLQEKGDDFPSDNQKLK